MELETLLQQLQDDAEFMRHVTRWHEQSAAPARREPFPAELHPRLVEVLHRQGIPSLYTHQADAFRAAREGRHVVVVTPTASGKTLCYNLPILQAMLENPEVRALYIFPTKALAQDQQAGLSALCDALGLGHIMGIYDGDTPASVRRRIRQEARILLTNPDMLHMGILPHHTQWSALFANLRFVVIDELHTYRGVFGSHVANVLRRLKRVAGFYGSAPQFIASSATIANPEELARRLTSGQVSLITRDGSPKAHKHFIFYNPPVVEPSLGIRRPALLEARDIAGRFLTKDIQTIVFARSRLGTELLLTYLRQLLEERGLPADMVRAYRGGYLPQERRAIELGLRQGKVRGVVATNALELGVDIGDLSVAILTGYPGSIASTWQQAGRAGRRARVSAAIFIAGPSPLDQYIVTHPDFILGRSPERALIAPDNPAILLSHLACAAFELPLAEGEGFGADDITPQLLSFLAEEGQVRLAGGRWHWAHHAYPAGSISLRSAGADIFTIVAPSEDGKKPCTIGTLERSSAPLLLHEGAVYMHTGQSYLVERLDWEAGLAYVRPAEVDYYTEASANTEVQISQILAEEDEGPLRRGFGEVIVHSKATSFRKIRLYTQEVIARQPIDLPAVSMPAGSFWYALPPAFLEQLQESGAWQGEPIRDYGPNWESQRRLARQRDGYRCRQCGTPEPPGREHDVHHLRPFREFGYLAGVNERYLQANALDNLITLCPRCHRLAETARQLRGTLAGLAHVLRHVAPVFLMCDPGDLGVVSTHDGVNGQPTIFIYERAPAGVGFSHALFDLPEGQLLRSAADVVRTCGCLSGCPSCVGPAGEFSGNVKAQVLRLLRLCLAYLPEAYPS
ncbi:MAG: DEAD/DEAH box helicase [Anaerolineae bacterium]